MAELEKVVIVGGGVGGCAVALALRSAGVQVEIHEKYGDFQGRATGFSIWAYAIRRLLSLGFERQRLQRVGREIVRQDIYSEAGELMMSLPVGEVSATVGAPTMDVDRRGLQEEIVDILGGAVYRFGSEVVAVRQDNDSAKAQLADGSAASGDLVIACDGIRSIVRDSFNDPPEFKMSSSDVVEGIAEFTHPWLAEGHHAQVWGRGRRAGIGLVGEGRVRWFLGGIVKPGEPEIDQAELVRRSHGLPDIVASVVAATEPAQIVRARIAHAYPVEHWRDRRVVLLGDAAHTLSPFAGMGACSAIEDAAQLVEQLTSDKPLDLALDTYVEQRKTKTLEIEKRGRRNERMMMARNPLVTTIRDWVLQRTPDKKLREIATEMATGE
ncbi:MAG: FAD-dependent monooxygenase [Solirubrobacterales bacterium]|nr:FAD-dependent monooxygenase [Solirubrobacterales bacterium]MBV9715362.1 FAD-dependent monooxygenase [Solirubrobacterales bacterium]